MIKTTRAMVLIIPILKAPSTKPKEKEWCEEVPCVSKTQCRGHGVTYIMDGERLSKCGCVVLCLLMFHESSDPAWCQAKSSDVYPDNHGMACKWLKCAPTRPTASAQNKWKPDDRNDSLLDTPHLPQSSLVHKNYSMPAQPCLDGNTLVKLLLKSQ